ncbi:hypothetical protein M3Y99_01504300 [Aphelenchoides fujianensis]|nr:hypothetical protein M3Y99_01504300 [Aphelenchoides fujianensis]
MTGGCPRVRPLNSPTIRMNRSSTIRSNRSNVTWDLPLTPLKPKEVVNEGNWEHWTRQAGTIFGFFARPIVMAIFMTFFFFGENYALEVVPAVVLLSGLGVLLAFRWRSRCFFFAVIAVEAASGLAVWIVGLALFIEWKTNGRHESSLLLPRLLERDLPPFFSIMLIYPLFHFCFLFVLVRGLEGRPLLPDFKSTRPLYYRLHKYATLAILLLLLIAFSVLASRLAALRNCPAPCTLQGDDFFMDTKPEWSADSWRE